MDKKSALGAFFFLREEKGCERHHHKPEIVEGNVIYTVKNENTEEIEKRKKGNNTKEEAGKKPNGEHNAKNTSNNYQCFFWEKIYPIGNKFHPANPINCHIGTCI